MLKALLAVAPGISVGFYAGKLHAAPKKCPCNTETVCGDSSGVSREVLGRHSWTLLHAVAEHYPENPSKKLQKHAKAFYAALGELYPCPDCAERFREGMRLHPPRVASRRELKRWTSDQHNAINVLLGKPTVNP